ncbi:hypothetical protein EJ077_27230 [Mesorhizobium sp. M8A.F.Ca.ET.057.01.1.1]|uniref:hypothetical protein n=1 Tax=Mesorhizobium sp. M8A.F.Ca.ET.057.01.1.1 TaxID=2493679 RepID=UPI000F756276|nr:hypothetical protein [Mesorhizobium sp. M8A.F.Ca.ET.057.01.1.1]AZO56679.1 hypothetical protein EJ077_27230 [Mesorhizobium sp. M8A.F.Ca.ET.057.01.1.1]
MALEYQTRQFEVMLCSDNEPDSMYLEVTEIVEEKSRIVLEIRYFESDGSITFTAFEKDLPFELIEHFGLSARESLTPVAETVE